MSEAAKNIQALLASGETTVEELKSLYYSLVKRQDMSLAERLKDALLENNIIVL